MLHKADLPNGDVQKIFNVASGHEDLISRLDVASRSATDQMKLKYQCLDRYPNCGEAGKSQEKVGISPNCMHTSNLQGFAQTYETS